MEENDISEDILSVQLTDEETSIITFITVNQQKLYEKADEELAKLVKTEFGEKGEEILKLLDEELLDFDCCNGEDDEEE